MKKNNLFGNNSSTEKFEKKKISAFIRLMLLSSTHFCVNLKFFNYIKIEILRYFYIHWKCIPTENLHMFIMNESIIIYYKSWRGVYVKL